MFVFTITGIIWLGGIYKNEKNNDITHISEKLCY